MVPERPGMSPQPGCVKQTCAEHSLRMHEPNRGHHFSPLLCQGSRLGRARRSARGQLLWGGPLPPCIAQMAVSSTVLLGPMASLLQASTVLLRCSTGPWVRSWPCAPEEPSWGLQAWPSGLEALLLAPSTAPKPRSSAAGLAIGLRPDPAQHSSGRSPGAAAF